MPAFETIKSYLVSLGFDPDPTSERRFNDALKRTGLAVEKFTKTSLEGFTIVGGAFVAATAAVAGATVGLMSSVAKQDLGFQVFARRMMMGTEAAKKMKIATDALGYSLEEIIWGPPELAERYKTLIQDQTKMMELLGGDKGEQAFRKIRDIEFQFTRLGPAMQYFAMRLTEDVINKLAGSPASLEQRMKDFVSWFESPEGFVKLSDTISNTIVPAIKGAVTTAMAFFTDIKQFIGWLESKNKVSSLTGEGPIVGLIDKQLSGADTTQEEHDRAMGEIKKKYFSWLPTDHWRKVITESAARIGIPTGLALAIAQKESGMDPNAPVGSSGEIGMFQLMPDSIKTLQGAGVMGDPNNPEQNILGGLNWLKMKPGHTWEEKIRQYNGRGIKAERYRDDVLRRWRENNSMLGLDAGPGVVVQPMSYGGGGGAPNVTVNVAHANATPDEIKRAVEHGIDEANRKAAKHLYARAQGAYA